MLSHSFNWNMDEIMQMNIDKLKARYPEGFDVVKANNRENNDVWIYKMCVSREECY